MNLQPNTLWPLIIAYEYSQQYAWSNSPRRKRQQWRLHNTSKATAKTSQVQQMGCACLHVYDGFTYRGAHRALDSLANQHCCRSCCFTWVPSRVVRIRSGHHDRRVGRHERWGGRSGQSGTTEVSGGLLPPAGWADRMRKGRSDATSTRSAHVAKMITSRKDTASHSWTRNELFIS